MRRSILLVVLTVICWGFAMACSGDSAPQSPGGTTDPVPGASGQIDPLVPGTAGDGEGSGGVNIPIIPVPVIALTIDGKPVVQDGLYAATELKAHASDAKGQATTFHWTLIGAGINGGLFADGAGASFKLPAVTDKSAYELTVIGSLGGKAVQQTINFFTVPAPTAKIIANVNQVGGIPVVLADGGVVLKGQKIQFSADSKFADMFKWKVAKNNGAAVDFDPSKEFIASDLGSYKVLLMAFGPGGNTGLQPVELKFNAKDNAVAIAVISQVTSPNFAEFLKPLGQYPVGSTVLVDASGIGNALESMSCSVTDAANGVVKPTKQSNSQFQFVLNEAGGHQLKCSYVLKEGYIASGDGALKTVVNFNVLAKAKAAITVDGQKCDAATPLVFEVGKTVNLSAATSSGNISSYSWFASAGGLAGGAKIDATLKLNDAIGHTLTLSLKGIGDSDSVTCTIYAQLLPNAVIASDSTVHDGRSYIAGSFQRAHATVTKGIVEDFDWRLLNVGGVVLNQKSLQKASDVFEFALSEVGALTLKLTSKLMNLVGVSNSIILNSKSGQVSLITPIDFTTIQSIAAVNDADVYFASPTAIFHKGSDGRVVQVKNISDHLALPDGFFARNAGDIYLLTTDGGFWRYTFKEGWVYIPAGNGSNQAIAGPSTGTRLFRVVSSRLQYGDVATGMWTKIADGQRYVTVQGSHAYAAASTSVGGVGSSPSVVKCTTVSCTPLNWKVPTNALMSWKAIGASASAVYLSNATSRIFTIKNNQVAMLGNLDSDDYVVAFSPVGEVVYAVGNKGGIYRINEFGVTFVEQPLAATVTHAAGHNKHFWLWDGANSEIMAVLDTTNKITAQPPLGTTTAPCTDQKQMWMVEDVAYVSVCSVIAGKPPLYTVWAAPYQGDITSNLKLQTPTPVVGVASDGAKGLLVMRSDGANTNYIQNLKADGTLEALKIVLNGGEFFTGMSGQFFVTNQGIRLSDGQNYSLIEPVVDAHYPIADGDVLYFAMANDTRVARYELSKGKVEVLANADPQEGPIVAVHNVGGRVFFLTATHLYRAEENAAPTVIYTAPAAPMTSMTSMNGHHMLVSMKSKGLVLVDLNEKTAQIINVNTETPAALETTSVGYNGTEFLFFGRDLQTNALFLHQYGAPQ